MGVEIQNSLNIRFTRTGSFFCLIVNDRLAQRNANHAMQIMRDYTLAAGQLAGIVCVSHQEFRCALGRVAQHRARYGAVVVNTLAALVTPSGQMQFSVMLAQEDESSLGMSQPQSRLKQRM